MIRAVTRAGRAAAAALTDDDVAHVRREVAAGRPAAVWFTAAAVGVPAGGSARVVAVGEPAEGDFLQVRRAGSQDTMFCSPQELTRTRPARKRAAAPAPPVPSSPAASAPASAGSSSAGSPSAVPPAPVPAAARPEPAPRPTAPRPTAPRPTGPRRKAADAAGMSVVLTATADGEWTVEVLAGRQRVVPPTGIPAADVAGAARSLPPAVAEAVGAALERARERQRERVEQLRAELDAAQQLLDQFGH